MIQTGKVDALFALRRDGAPLVGRDRIDLLQAVQDQGSISAAAKALRISYKAAWDSVNTINNLLPRPAVVSQVGGRHGGGARVTEDGQALIAGFRLLEDRLRRATALFAGDDAGTIDPFSLLWGFGMKTSARNTFRCIVSDIRTGGVNSEVLMPLSSACTLAAVITTESVQDLGLTIGSEVMALIKSSFVMLAKPEDGQRISARNRLMGVISRREDGEVNCEITLDVGEGKSIVAVITRDAADDLDLKVGDEAMALFKASHVILAVG